MKQPLRLPDYVTTLRISAVLHLVGAVVIFFFPDEIFYLINNVPNVLKIGEVIPNSIEHFWQVMASSAMFLIATLSWMGSRSPHILGYCTAIVVYKLATIAGFAHMYYHQQHYFAYLLGILVDLPTGAFLFWQIVRERRRERGRRR